MVRIHVASLYVGLAFASVACSSESSKPAAPANPCGLHTTFAGDENCILAPATEEGVQLHVGPSSYDDPNVINAVGADGKPIWLMEPGDERTQCYRLITPNADAHHYFRQQYRMRKGSHHMIIMAAAANDGTPEGWWAPTGGVGQQFCGNLIQSIGGTQSIVEDLPPGGVVAPEDQGLARELTAHQPLDMQLHFYNTSDEVHLREVWVNFYYKPDSEVTQNLGMLGGFTSMDSDPTGGYSCGQYHCFKAGVTGTVTGQCLSSQAIAPHPVRVVTLFGHAHVHNKRFAVYHETASGGSELIYDSYDGPNAPTFTYDSVVKNPVPNPTQHITGAASGQLLLQDGDKLRFTCDIVNDTQNDFYGLNEVQNDEMCHLFGSVAGAGFPCFNLTGSRTTTGDGGVTTSADGGTDGGP